MTSPNLHLVVGEAHTAKFVLGSGDMHMGGLVIQPPVGFSDRLLEDVNMDTGIELEERASTQFGTYFGFQFAETEFSHVEEGSVRDAILEQVTFAAQTLVEYADFTHEKGINLMLNYHGATEEKHGN